MHGNPSTFAVPCMEGNLDLRQRSREQLWATFTKVDSNHADNATKSSNGHHQSGSQSFVTASRIIR